MIALMQTAISLAVFAGGWKLIKWNEPEYAEKKDKRFKRIFCAAAIAYMILAAVLIPHESMSEAFLNALFWGSIALSAYCDGMTTEVYDFCYLPALVSGCALLCISLWQGLPELLVFGLIQLFVFRKLFGASDCIAFWICALHMTADGKSLLDYALLMLYVWVIFAVVQMLFKNVNKKGNLKVGKPLIPYIAAVMLVVSVCK